MIKWLGTTRLSIKASRRIVFETYQNTSGKWWKTTLLTLSPLSFLGFHRLHRLPPLHWCFFLWRCSFLAPHRLHRFHRFHRLHRCHLNRTFRRECSFVASKPELEPESGGISVRYLAGYRPDIWPISSRISGRILAGISQGSLRATYGSNWVHWALRPRGMKKYVL